MTEPLLLLFAGKAGTGKTTLAREICRRTGIAFFDYDAFVQPFLVAIERKEGIGQSRLAFYQSWRSASYATLLGPVEENLRLGVSVIVAAPFSSELADPLFPRKLRKEIAAPFRLRAFQMAPPREQHLSQLLERGSRRDSDFLSGQVDYRSYAPVPCAWEEEGVILLSGTDLAENAARVLEAISPDAAAPCGKDAQCV